MDVITDEEFMEFARRCEEAAKERMLDQGMCPDTMHVLSGAYTDDADPYTEDVYTLPTFVLGKHATAKIMESTGQATVARGYLPLAVCIVVQLDRLLCTAACITGKGLTITHDIAWSDDGISTGFSDREEIETEITEPVWRLFDGAVDFLREANPEADRIAAMAEAVVKKNPDASREDLLRMLEEEDERH